MSWNSLNNTAFDPNVESAKLQSVSRKFSHLYEQANTSLEKKAAVLLAIFQYNGIPHVILTERSKNLRTHAGQVALPGGKVDDIDNSIADAATREAKEEIGLLPEDIQVLGTLLPVYTALSKVLVFPVVGFIRNIANVKLNINSDEVSSVFAVPLEAFCEVTQHTTYGKYHFPKFDWNCQSYGILNPDTEESETIKQLLYSNRKYVIFGMTAIMLNIYSAIFLNRSPSISLKSYASNLPPSKSNIDFISPLVLPTGKL